jgi:hypothetical protein
VGEAVVYHEAYDELESARRASALTFFLCLRTTHSNLYGVKDMRRHLWALITDCSDNAFSLGDERFRILFK